MFLFLSYSFGIETINTFINTRGFLENHTRFKTKMGKAYPFSDQNGVKPVADGAAHTYIDYIREYSPHPPLGKSACVSSKIMARGHFVISVIKC